MLLWRFLEDVNREESRSVQNSCIVQTSLLPSNTSTDDSSVQRYSMSISQYSMSIPLGMRIALILSPLANPYWDHSKYARFPGRKEVEWYDGSGRQKGQLSRVPRVVLGFNRLQEEFLPTEDYVYGRAHSSSW